MTHETTATLLPVDRIRIREGHNPRTYFEPVKFQQLLDSIRTDGVIQAITVRGNEDDGYELIAGERRWRASRELGLATIPAVVVDADDVGVLRMAMVENLHRDGLTIPEEAVAAQTLVDLCNGDHDAVASALGWSMPKLKHRLHLLHASPAVMQALTEGRINVGHCELLASLPAETQDRVLAKVLEHGASVQMLKEQLEGVSLPLAHARFDQAQCRGCPHNSETQASLFETAISLGKCSNRSCYQSKTDAWLLATRETLREEYPAVAFLTEKQPNSTIPLVVTGDCGVGPTQLNFCKGCAHYGAALDNRLGPTTGRVDAPLCFNKTCHSEKVAEYAALSAPSAPANELEEDDDAPAATTGGSATSPRATSSKNAVAKKKPKKGKAAAKDIPTVLGDQYQRVLRDTVIDRLDNGAVEPILALAVFGLATLTHYSCNEGYDDVCEAIGIKRSKHAVNDTKTVLALAQLDKPALQVLLQKSAMRFFDIRSELDARPNLGRINRRQLVAGLIETKGYDPLSQMRVDEQFLYAHSKASLDGLMVESGFKAFVEAGPDGAKRYKAILAMSKKDMIDAILGAGFDFSTFLPTGLRQQLSMLAKQAAR